VSVERSTPEVIGRPVGLLWRIGAGAAVVAGTTALAVDGLPDWEARVFDVLNAPAGLEGVLWLPMQLGSLFGPLVVAGASWLTWRKWRPSAGVVVSGVVAWQLAKVLKNAVERGRPFEMVDEFADRFGTPYEGLGFVSGHSAVAFTMAAVLSPYLTRRQRVAVYGVACVVGLARIQVSAHLPLDVIGGAALGYALANVWNLAVGVPVRRAAGAGDEDAGSSSVQAGGVAGGAATGQPG
jgi:membrane-associated phospholipid phosphatase